MAEDARLPLGSSIRALATRPQLWPTAIRQAGRLAAPGWWRRRPFLPVPDPDYLAFRLETQYGGDHHEPTPEDLVTYLTWCRNQRRESRRRR